MKTIAAWKQIRSYRDFVNYMQGKSVKQIYPYLKFGYDVTQNCYYVKYHNTKIVIFYPDGKIVIDNGNYKTNTTKKYINMFARDFVNISQKNFKWFYRLADERNEYAFNKTLTVKHGIKLVIE